MNGTLNYPGRLPKLLLTHGKRAAKKDGEVVTCFALCGTFYRARRHSFSLLWRGVSLLNETQTTSGRVLKSRAVHKANPG
jgi:hypothetical protein